MISANSGFTDSGLIPIKWSKIKGDFENGDEIINDFGDEREIFENLGRKFLSMSDNILEEYRSDTLNDISSGLNMVASGIKVITTILSLFGADTVDR